MAQNKRLLVIIAILLAVIAAAAVILIVRNSGSNDSAGSDVTSPGATVVPGDTGGTGVPGFTGGILDPNSSTAGSSGNTIPSAGGYTRMSGPVKATLSFDVNKSAVPQVLSMLKVWEADRLQPMIETAVDVVNNLSLEGTWDGPSARLDILLKGQQLAYAAVTSDGTNITAVSDVLPDGTIIQTTFADLLKYYGRMNVSLTPAEIGLLEDAVTAVIRKVDSGIASSAASVAENGSWTIEGTVFTSRSKITATPREITIMLFSAVQDELRDPQIAELLTRFGVYTQDVIDQLQRRIRDAQGWSDESYPELDAYRYTNAAGNAYNDGTLTTYYYHKQYNSYSDTYDRIREEESKIQIGYGTAGQNIYARMSVKNNGGGGGGDLTLTADAGGRNYIFDYNLKEVWIGSIGESLPLRITIAGTTAANGEHEGRIDGQLGNIDIISVKYAIRQGNPVTDSFSTAGKEVLSLGDLYSSDFTSRILPKGMELLGKLGTIMPEAYSLVTSLIMK